MAEASRTGRGRRTPEGMTRHTIYIPQTAAAALDGAADRLHRDLGGMLPRHRILTALIDAAVAAAPTVRQQLRRELLAQLDGGEGW